MVQRRSSNGGIRLIFAAVIAIFSLVSYCNMNQTNPVTGEKQHIDISPEQEVALGLQAAPEMAQQFGGLDQNQQDQAVVEKVGHSIVEHSDATKSSYQFDYHLLADRKTINAFALPGGQIFITRALYSQLKTPGELAGVLAHETGHVVGRHSAEQMAKARLTQGLTGAAAVATTDPNNPRSYSNAAVAQMVGQFISLKYSRNNESEADALGVKLMSEAGYDPRSMIAVMEILKKSGGPSGPDFFATHPNPTNRIGAIQAEIKKDFPNGVPSGLQK
ncbi:M48 family metallopeptidase [soil metagenome]